MKKLLALILALAMVCALSACGEKSPTSLGARPDPTAPSLDSKPTAPDTEPTTPPVTTEATEATKETTPVNYGETFHLAEAVFYDQDGIRATVQEQDLSVTFQDYTECSILITIENTTNVDIDFSLSEDLVIIDNYQVSAWLFETVKAGKTVEGELELDIDQLYLQNISAPKTFSAAYYAFDDETYETVSEGFGSFTSDAPDPGPAVLSSDSILFSDSGITVADCGLYELDDGDCIYYMQIQNSRDGEIIADLTDLTVNGHEIDEWDYLSIYADSIAICTFTLHYYELAEFSLDFDTITEMDFTINFEEASYDDIVEAPISINFE